MQLTPNISVYVNTVSGNIEVKIKDLSQWPVEGNNRSDFYIGFYAYKVSENKNVNPSVVYTTALPISGGVLNVVEDEILSEAGVPFIVGEDGYHRLYMVAFPKTPSNVDGDFYYNGTSILYREDGVYSVKTFDELLSLSAIPEEYLTNFPINPRISTELDRISEKYSRGRSGSSDSDYKKWTTLYIQLYGALLSFDKGAFLDYERKVRAANTLF